MEDLKRFKNFSKVLSLESGKIIKKYFRTDFSIESKKDNSPVTIADKSAEEKMREIIMKEFPNHGIVGEEFGKHNPDAEYQWILDPIDGTKSFISGALSFGTLIALTKKGKPVLGIINHPILNEFLIGDNATTELNGVRVRVRERIRIEDCTLLATDHLMVGDFQDRTGFDKLTRTVKLYRNWGDCYGYYLVATGFADIMLDPVMNVWDSMALIPGINGSGGIITDY
jgi:myo-inositol-1(or 4)-monophosphatase